MNHRDAIRNLSTGDVEIGLNPLKRKLGEMQGWVCERCGATKPGNGERQPCSSKTGAHRWRKA